MATTLEELQVKINANISDYTAGLSKAMSVTKSATNQMNLSVGKMNASLGKLGAVVAGAFSIGALTKFGKECINVASDLQEVQNVVDVTFGSGNKEVEAFAKNAATQFGLSELAAKKYASTTGAMLKSMGVNAKDVDKMSIAIAGLTGDMASFYNLDSDTAFNKLRAGISGETEPLKQLGINMSKANLEAFALSQGITTSYEKLSESSKLMLRYNYILNATADAQGDFARTSDSWANQTRILSLQMESLKSTLGAGLINVLTPALQALNQFIAKLQVAANAFKNFTASIFGDASGSDGAVTTADNVAQSVSNIGSAASDTAKKVKKATQGLASFDKLNMLSKSDSNTGGASAATNAGSALASSITSANKELDETTNKVRNIMKIFTDPEVGLNIGKKISEKVREIDWGYCVGLLSGGIINFISSAIDIATGLMDGSGKSFNELFDSFGEGFVKGYKETGADLHSKISVQNLIDELIDGDDAMAVTWGNNILDAQAVGKIISDNLSSALTKAKNGDWKGAANDLSNAIKIAFPFGTGANSIFGGVGGALKTALENALNTIGSGKVSEVWEKLKSTASTKLGEFKSTVNKKLTEVKGVFDNVFENIHNAVNGMMYKINNSVLIKYLKKMKESVVNYCNPILEKFENFLNDIIGGIKKMFAKYNALSAAAKKLLGWTNASITANIKVDRVKLAKGGITTGPTNALIGEAGYQEAVIPLRKDLLEKYGLGKGGTSDEEISLMREQNTLLRAILAKDTTISSSQVFNAVKSESRDVFVRTGKNALVF